MMAFSSALSRASYTPPCCVCVLYRPGSSSRAFLQRPTLPSGGLWIHEIKHDGFRIIACKNGAQVRLYSRPKSCGSAWAVATVRTTLTATNAVLSLIS
jgi:ATP-dependent DNA ligase